MIIEYATDTYSVFNFNKDEIYSQFAMSGRFITAIIGKVVKIANISEQGIYFLSSIFAFIFIFLSIFKLYKIVKKDVNNKMLQIIIPILIVINPFSIELFLFIEKGIMWFGVFMCICAVDKIIKYFENKNKKYLLFAIFLIFIANCSYQGVVGIFVSISLVYIIKYSKNIKEFIKNNFAVGLIYGIPTVLNYILIKTMYKTSRLNGKILIDESIKKIIFNIDKMVVSSYDLLPKYLFIFCIIFTFACFCCKIKNRENTKKWYFGILEYLYIIFGTTIITIVPQIVQPTDSIWFVARSTYSFAALYGILLLYLFLNYKMDKVAISRIIVISSILLIFEFQKFGIIIKDRYKLNEQDYTVSMQIIDKIKNYEKNTGKGITKIQIYKDKNPGFTYEGIFATGDINVKAYSTNWSTKAILEYYLKRKLNEEELDEKIKNNFSEKDWNKFNEEQIIFSENTIILCNF